MEEVNHKTETTRHYASSCQTINTTCMGVCVYMLYIYVNIQSNYWPYLLTAGINQLP